MKIPVIVVDDERVDRYTVRRRLARHEDFGEVYEVEAGDRFLEEFFDSNSTREAWRDGPMILMDINMPRMNGFETVSELERRIAEKKGSNRAIVMMFSSSADASDISRAQAFDLVKGYILKPLEDEDVDKIRTVYHGYFGDRGAAN